MSEKTSAGPVDNRQSRQSVLITLPYTAVQITGGFWGSYHQAVNRAVSLRHSFAMLAEAGNLHNLRVAAAGLESRLYAFP